MKKLNKNAFQVTIAFMLVLLAVVGLTLWFPIVGAIFYGLVVCGAIGTIAYVWIDHFLN
jgi:hypothetical protein